MKEYRFEWIDMKSFSYAIIEIKKVTYFFHEDASRFNGKIEVPSGAVFEVYFGAETPIHYKRVRIEAEKKQGSTVYDKHRNRVIKRIFNMRLNILKNVP